MDLPDSLPTPTVLLSISIVSNGVDGSSGLGMGNLGSVNLGGISGNDGTIDMSDKSTWGIGVWVDSMSEVGSFSSSNSWGVSRDDSSVGVGDKGLGRADGDESSENQKLHVDVLSVLR